MSSFKALLGYHSQMFYKDNQDPQSKLQSADENVAILRDLIKKLKVNLAKSQKL